jgi:hypothetical protein
VSSVIIDINTTINAPVIEVQESVYSVVINSATTTSNNTIDASTTIINSVIEASTENTRSVTIDVERGVVPDASSTVKGKMKLYSSLGSATDGSIDQNTANTNFELKVDKVSGESLLSDVEITRLSKFSGGRTEIDFGSLPIFQKEFTITDASVLVTSNITASVAYEAPTGKDLDELEMDSLYVVCGQATNGTFKMLVRCLDGCYLADKFKINYSITV